MGGAMFSDLDEELDRMVLPDLASLTPEQLRQVELYRWCNTCGSPRELFRETRQVGKRTETFVAIVCPNGHPQG